MRFHSADHAARVYRQLHEQLYHVRGLDFLSRRTVCAHCGGGPVTVIGGGFRRMRGGIAERAETREVCASCRHPWEGEERTEIRRPGEGGPSVRDERVGLLSQLRPVIENRPRAMTKAAWQAHLVAWFTYIEPGKSSYAYVARLGLEEIGPDAGVTWSDRGVKRAIRFAREHVWSRIRDRERRGWRRTSDRGESRGAHRLSA